MSAALSVVVQSCPARKDLAEALLSRLAGMSAPGMDLLGIAWDETPGGGGPWGSGQRAWAMASGERHLVIQDDAIVCQDFLGAALMLSRLAPHAALTFCAFNGAVERARAAGKHWVRSGVGAYGQANLLKREDALGFVPWEAGVPESERVRLKWNRSDDRRLSAYLKHLRVPILLPVPCLVQHDLVAPSLMGRPPKVGRYYREARWFIGDQSPFSIDWSRGLDSPERG